MGGEHCRKQHHAALDAGSSPRGRGTQSSPATRTSLATDHPRVGGGTRGREPVRRLDDRIIPAWAGNTPSTGSRAGSTSDHPRVGGEHSQGSGLILVLSGSSPRGRGTPPAMKEPQRPGRIIPAWAGNTADKPMRTGRTTDHPRVGGEHEVPVFSDDEINGSSPRGRGTRISGSDVRYSDRIIPAWAGNTLLETLRR